MPNYKGPRYAAIFGAVGTYAKKVLDYNPIAYWPLWETSGGAAVCQISALQNGTYTGVTLGQTGIGDGNTCPLFDGINDTLDVYSATFRDAFSGAAGSIMIWFKVSGIGVWTDGALRRLVYWDADANNYIRIHKNTTNNQFRFAYNAGGTANGVIVNSYSSVDWVCAGISWDKAANQMKAYLEGSQTGSTQTGLGVWAGNLASTTTSIGCYQPSSPSQVWDGYIAHAAAWDSALGDAVFAALAVV